MGRFFFLYSIGAGANERYAHQLCESRCEMYSSTAANPHTHTLHILGIIISALPISRTNRLSHLSGLPVIAILISVTGGHVWRV